MTNKQKMFLELAYVLISIVIGYALGTYITNHIDNHIKKQHSVETVTPNDIIKEK